MKLFKILAFVLLTVTSFMACNKNEEPELPKPTISDIEIGLNNNEIGVTGRDFHFNAEVLAGDKIDIVQIKIVQRSTETYSGTWGHEIIWEQYKGAKNATVHKHFDIPADAIDGKYDFLIIVKDQNGTILEEKRILNIYKAENLPVDPELSVFNITANGKFFYRNGKLSNPEITSLKKDDVTWIQATLGNIKGDGKMYIVYINKKLNHRPETIDKIDMSKAMIYDVYEHSGWTQGDYFSNIVSGTRFAPDFIIGASQDNNVPIPNPVSDDKAWETGTYYVGVVYQNTTYNISFYKYIEIDIEM